MRGLGLRIGIIALVLIVGFVVRQYFARNAGDLAVGDCFDEPTGTSETVENVQPHACTDLHDAEVIFVGNYEPASATYPTDPEFETFILDRCTGAFNVYTGLDYTTAQDLEYAAFTPTSDGWSSGNKKVTCYVVKVDKTKFNASIKKAS
jgi:hypothetical protein